MWSPYPKVITYLLHTRKIEALMSKSILLYPTLSIFYSFSRSERKNWQSKHLDAEICRLNTYSLESSWKVFAIQSTTVWDSISVCIFGQKITTYLVTQRPSDFLRPSQMLGVKTNSTVFEMENIAVVGVRIVLTRLQSSRRELVHQELRQWWRKTFQRWCKSDPICNRYLLRPRLVRLDPEWLLSGQPVFVWGAWRFHIVKQNARFFSVT